MIPLLFSQSFSTKQTPVLFENENNRCQILVWNEKIMNPDPNSLTLED